MGRKLRFEWDQYNVEHIARHGVSSQEFEEVFLRPMKEVVLSTKGEDRVAAIGKTARGRHLFLAYTLRRGRVRPITAYTPPREKRREYDQEFETES